MKIYREVKAKNPGKDGDYRTNLGLRFYRSDLKRWVTVKGSDYIHTNVEYWLKPIEITEEEIEEILCEHVGPTDNEMLHTSKGGWPLYNERILKLSKAILSKLKGE